MARPCGSAPVVWVGWEAVDQNQHACGGAGEGGNLEGAAQAFSLSRWRGVVQGRSGYGPNDGILLMTEVSSRLLHPASHYHLHPCGRMQAMIGSAPLQAGQVSSATFMYPTASRQRSSVQIGCPTDLSMSMAKMRFSGCGQTGSHQNRESKYPKVFLFSRRG